MTGAGDDFRAASCTAESLAWPAVCAACWSEESSDTSSNVLATVTKTKPNLELRTNCNTLLLLII